MINFTKYKVILWDFDGVIMDSMPVRDKGFEIVLSSYPKQQVDELLQFHQCNGGLSRYVKFRYFFERIRKEPVTDEDIARLSEAFSQIMRQQLVNSKLLIEDSVSFIRQCGGRYKMHIVSGSDENELRYLCKSLNIDHHFISIHGSPTPKTKLVSELVSDQKYNCSDIIFIGDSKNDWNAASAHGIDFAGYNNLELANLGIGYIHSSYANVQV